MAAAGRATPRWWPSRSGPRSGPCRSPAARRAATRAAGPGSRRGCSRCRAPCRCGARSPGGTPPTAPGPARRPPSRRSRGRTAADPRSARRLPGLIAGLLLFGLGIAAMADAGLGLGPWEVFHQGIGRHIGVDLGTVSILVGIPVLLLWWPLGERLGIGTVLNVALIGTATNVALPVLPQPSEPIVQLAM